jgi:antitoxin (DNA-binding transcriptional repressor) of toxin-antitoxin stability system
MQTAGLMTSGYNDSMSSNPERGLMTSDPGANILGVAETKSRFSELIDRVRHGERFLVARRGTLVLALVPPDQAAPPGTAPAGLAAVAGALADWDDLPQVLEEIYAARRRARDRAAPDMG